MGNKKKLRVDGISYEQLLSALYLEIGIERNPSGNTGGSIKVCKSLFRDHGA